MNFHHNYTRNILIIFTALIYSCSNTDNDLKIDYPPGGYDFSKNITNKDFYHYPLIGKISRRDSFWKTYYDAHLFKLFKEPNISLEPSKEPIVRLVCSGFHYYVITLTQKEITIKSSDDSYFPQFDISKLTEIERMHYIILRQGYPLDEARSPNMPVIIPPPGPEEEYEKKLDSITKITPVLLKREYYDYLLKKGAVKDTFNFSTSKIKISKTEFIKFITMLNKSGYWSLPYNITDESCSGATDSGILSLEINAGGKYNYVESEDACIDTANFYKVCNELLKMAKINDKGMQLLMLNR